MLWDISIFACLFSILLVAFWIRIQGVDELPEGQFTETDAYFYYWQAHLISEHGHLPTRDMHRWLPLGRDLGQTLNLYGYVLAYTHKTVSAVIENITLYDVTLYMPVLCFCIGLGSLYLYLYHTYGRLFSSVVGILLATLPGSIERSTAGFGDRDAWCLMIGLLAVVTYLAALHETSRKRLMWTLTSGFIVFLGGISWEGFGVFLSVILIVELYRFLSSETEEGLGFYLLWVLCFVPTLYLASEAYRSGYGFAKHLAAFVLVPPVMLLGIRVLRHLLLSTVEKLCRHARTLSLGLILASLTIAIGYVFMELDTFADTTVPLSQNTLMQAMTELENPHFDYWIFRYGSVFILGSIGLIVVSKHDWDQTSLLAPLVVFMATTFFREPLETSIFGVSQSRFLFFIAVTCMGIGFLISAWLQESHEKRQFTMIAFTAWFVFWVALSRDAKRYDFFIGVPLAFFTAELIDFFSNVLSRKVKKSRHRSGLKNCIASALLAGILFIPPIGAHATRAIFAASGMRNAMPRTPLADALHWIKKRLPNAAIVAGNWRYGSQLNVLGGVKTITDQDTYLQNWIRLYNQHVHNAQNDREVLTFLKTHGVTHLMLTKNDPQTLLRGKLSEAFRSVYPTQNFAEAPVKVWEIHYPPDIKPNPKYLKTGIPEIDAQLQLQ